MTVRVVTTVTAIATTIEDEARARPRDVDHAARAGARVEAGVVAPDLGTGIGDDHPREALLRPGSNVVGLIHVPRLPMVLGGPGRAPLPLGGIHEVTAPCRRLHDAVHDLPFVAIAVARLAVIAGRVHRQGLLRGRLLPQENAVVPLPAGLLCQSVLEEAETRIRCGDLF